MATMTRLRFVLGSVGMGIATVAMVATSAGAAQAASITVTPDKKLSTSAAGATVSVSGKHLGDGIEVALLECDASIPNTSECNLSGDIATTTVSSKGVLAPTSFVVYSSYTSESGPVNCLTSKCDVVVSNYNTLAQLASALVKFKK